MPCQSLGSLKRARRRPLSATHSAQSWPQSRAQDAASQSSLCMLRASAMGGSAPSPATGMAQAFAVLLREHRLAAGLTQASLADLAGLSTRSIQHLEAGLGQPYVDTARRLADALALTPAARVTFAAAARPAPRRSGRF